MNTIFLFTFAQAALFPIKYTIESMIFQIWYVPLGYEELAGGIGTNQE